MSIAMRMVTTKTRTTFDPNNKDHRADFAIFRHNGSWAHSKNQYVLEYPFETIPSMITSKLLDFYLNKEHFVADNIDKDIYGASV